MLKKNITQFVIFFIFSCMVVLGISSESYAWTYTDWVDYLGQLTSNEDVPQAWKTKIGKFFQYESEFSPYLNDYTNFYFDMGKGDTTVWATNATITVTRVNTDPNYAPIQFNSITWYEFRRDSTKMYFSSTNKSNLSNYPALIEVPESIEAQFTSNMWFQNKYDLGFTFDPVGVTQVNYNGYNGLNAKKINGTIITLGTLTNPSEKYKYYRFNLLDSNGQKVAYLDYNTDNTYYTAENMDAFLPPLTIYIRRRTIYLKEIYTLVIYASDEQINVNNTNIKDSEVFTYIFLPENAIISGSTITNTGSGDVYSTQESTNDIIDFLGDTESANNSIDNFLSGDSSSFANSIGYSPITNPFVGIIENTLTTIVNILLGSGNETLTIALRDQPIVLHSENFTIPDGALKTFITLVTNGFLIWAIIKYGFELYQWINTGRLQNLVNEANGHWYKALF